jgi:hypothetical protein
VALDDVTSLAFLPGRTSPFQESQETFRRGQSRTLPSGDEVDALVSTCIDVSQFVGHRLRATAAHRSQYPIDPEMFPEHIVQEMFGVEYFVQVLPERDLSTSLLDD